MFNPVTADERLCDYCDHSNVCSFKSQAEALEDAGKNMTDAESLFTVHIKCMHRKDSYPRPRYEVEPGYIPFRKEN